MHDVGASWLMTELAPSPAIVSLVQTATTGPVFLFALLAGALADRVDRRRYLITVNALLAVAVFALAALTASGQMTPALLLFFTFLLGIGAAFVAPAWQAVVPNLVPREALQPAIALNSLGINIARAIGPALAGILITSVGLTAPFFANAVSILVILGALLLWRPAPVAPPVLPPEPIIGAMLTGLRHAAHNAPLKATMLRSLAFFTFASAFWALLPLVARELPGAGASFFGLLMGAVGCGAVSGALTLPRLRRIVGPNRLTEAGTVALALAMLMLGFGQSAAGGIAASFLAGLGWIAVLTSLNLSAQTALPNWVRARGLAISLMVFYGSMAVGAACWGQVAARSSLRTALLAAALGAILAMILTRHARLGQGDGRDLGPALAWAEPTIATDSVPEFDRGPVMVTISYEIEPADHLPFLAAMAELSGERRRDGAHDWGIFQDVSDPRLWVEWFLLPNWAEHLRQHARATGHDLALHSRARAFHRGASPPQIRHLIAPSR